MVDSSVQGSEFMEVNEAPPPSPIMQHQQKKYWKTCVECGTSKTPLWRKGPAGPKSLCNACGIRHSKKQQTDLGPNKGKNKDNHEKGIRIMNYGDGSSSSNGESYEQIRLRKVVNAMKEVFSRKPEVDERIWNMLGEEEQAAFVLMSFST